MVILFEYFRILNLLCIDLELFERLILPKDVISAPTLLSLLFFEYSKHLIQSVKENNSGDRVFMMKSHTLLARLLKKIKENK